MAELYKRLTDGYQYEETEYEARGTEVYIRHDDAAGGLPFASLPVPGVTAMIAPNGSANSLCVCQSAIFNYENDDVLSGKWTFKFETPNGGGAGKADADDRQLSLQGEVVVTDPGAYGSAWEWKSLTANRGSLYGVTIPVMQPVSKFVITGNFTIPISGLSTAQFQTWFAKVKAAGGKINHAAFDTGTGNVFAPGQVLFSGIRGGTYSPPTGGAKKWKFDLSFDYRVVNDKDVDGNPISSMDWNYLWAAGSSTLHPGIGTWAGWDMPWVPTGSQYLFATADLTAILS